MIDPYFEDHDLALYLGDARAVLEDFDTASVDCVVTSPPYYGLRDYGVDGQLGHEATPGEYVATLARVFAEVARVLRPDGSMWLNLGDSYAGKANGGSSYDRHRGHGHRSKQGIVPERINNTRHAPYKSMLGMPWRIAFALMDDGWAVRNDIAWTKPNAMPESVGDRLQNRWEHVFLLTRSTRYHFALDAIREPHAAKTVRDFGDGQSNGKAFGNPLVHDNNWEPKAKTRRLDPRGVNPGDVWAISTQPYAGSHFATFPPALARRCVLAGCPEDGTVLDPFVGTGTSLMVARQLGRQGIGIDLKASYLDDAIKRIGDTPFDFSVTA